MQAYGRSHRPAEKTTYVVVPLPSIEQKDLFEPKSTLWFGSDVTKPQPKSNLLEKSCAVFPIGSAIDDLPLFLNVKRSINAKSKIIRALGVNCETSLPTDVQGFLEQLNNAIEQHCVTGGIIELEGRRFYETKAVLGEYFQGTLFGLALNGSTGGTTVLNEHGENYSKVADRKKGTMTIAVPLDSKGSIKEKGITGYLWSKLIPGSETAAEAMIYRKYQSGINELEPLFWESLSGFPKALFQFEARSSNYDEEPVFNTYAAYGGAGAGPSNVVKVYRGLISDKESYLKAIYISSSNPTFLIPVEDMIENGIVKIAEQLHENYHSKNIVMADLKPDNIIMLKTGPKIIDDGGAVESGKIPPVFTPQWASPEQTLGFQVSPSSDVYSLGQMTAKVFKASFYGELKRFKVAGDSQIIEVLAVAGAHIPPETTGLSTEARSSWQSFLTACCGHDAQKRISNAHDFVVQIKELLQKYPLNEMEPIIINDNYNQSFSLARFPDETSNTVARRLIDSRQSL